MSQDEAPLTPDDLVISRIVEGTSTNEDWARLEIVAATDCSVWERLAASIRIEAGLRTEMEGALAVADLVEARPPRPSAVRRRMWLGSGWAAALAIAGAWTLSGALPSPETPVPAGSPHVAAHAAQRLHELPPILVGAEPSAQPGAVDVYYVRRWIEQGRVEESFRVGHDDLGRVDAIPVSAPARYGFESL